MSTLARDWSGTRTPKTSRCRSPAVRLFLAEDGNAPFQLPLAGTMNKHGTCAPRGETRVRTRQRTKHAWTGDAPNLGQSRQRPQCVCTAGNRSDGGTPLCRIRTRLEEPALLPCLQSRPELKRKRGQGPSPHRNYSLTTDASFKVPGCLLHATKASWPRMNSSRSSLMKICALSSTKPK